MPVSTMLYDAPYNCEIKHLSYILQNMQEQVTTKCKKLYTQCSICNIIVCRGGLPLLPRGLGMYFAYMFLSITPFLKYVER